MRLNEQAVAERLFADKSIRQRIERDYALKPGATSAIEFVNQVIGEFDQAPSHTPLTPRSNTKVFEAAVLALGSNSRSWATFLTYRDKLTDALGGLDPAQACGVEVSMLAALLPGQTSTGDAKAILGWASLLADLDAKGESYYDGVIGLSEAIRHRGAEHGIDLPDERLMLCVVGHLIDGPPKRWSGPQVDKLRGMRFALGSEFFRNLGWNGFKPDRHVIRLLDAWVPDIVAQQADTAEELARLAGRNTKELRTMMRYSLAGIAISPTENYSRTDNLIWLLGAYAETKRQTDLLLIWRRWPGCCRR